DSDFQQLAGGGADGFFSFAFNIDLKKGSAYPRMPRIGQLKQSTATVLMFDVVFNPVTEKVNGSPQYNSVNPANRFRSIGTRHDKGTVINYCDGHSRYWKINSVTNTATYGAASNGEPLNPEIIWAWAIR